MISKKTKIGLGLLFSGFLFMAIGVMRGEPAVVLQKAIRICLECIGIG